MKDYWTTNSCLVESFQHSNLRCLSKNRQKLHKTVKKQKSLEFMLFSGSFSSFPKVQKSLQTHITLR